MVCLTCHPFRFVLRKDFVAMCVSLAMSGVLWEQLLTVFVWVSPYLGCLEKQLLMLCVWVSLCFEFLESNYWRYLCESRNVWGVLESNYWCYLGESRYVSGSWKAIIDAICVSPATFGVLGKQLLTSFAWVSLCLGLLDINYWCYLCESRYVLRFLNWMM